LLQQASSCHTALPWQTSSGGVPLLIEWRYASKGQVTGARPLTFANKNALHLWDFCHAVGHTSNPEAAVVLIGGGFANVTPKKISKLHEELCNFNTSMAAISRDQLVAAIPT